MIETTIRGTDGNLKPEVFLHVKADGKVDVQFHRDNKDPKFLEEIAREITI